MNNEPELIETSDSPNLKQLSDRLAEQSREQSTGWPEKQLELLSRAGVDRWFIPTKLCGMGWNNSDLIAGYIELASACLTTTFILTQRVAAIRRICATENESLRERLLAGLLDGSGPATVGISHLTTSNRHQGKPALNASPVDGGFQIDGFSPWVTGASGAEFLVMGAEQADGAQVLFAIPTESHGITIAPSFKLVALSDSQTGLVKCDKLMVGADWILAGPTENVLVGPSASTGSFQTSALAIGLSQAAIRFVQNEARNRAELSGSFAALEEQLDDIKNYLFSVAAGEPGCTKEFLRTDANSLVLRSTQAALVAAKGTGFVQGHPVGRWCQEALFFLVWSCPQSVLNANLCELAGIE